ncbi:MAG: peptidylprolyl isomerase [Candidatus Marinimicrobia bacterium]|nr:peptidylprolyl isomerase [Candidatus Neomarinimicrobiota bacterium]
MKYFKYLSFTLFIFAFILIINCERNDSRDGNIVAKIEEQHAITSSDLKKYVGRHYYLIKYTDRSKAYHSALNSMIISQLKVIDFFNRGLHKKQSLMQNIKRTINEELVIQYYKNYFLNKYINEQSVRNAYDQMDRKVSYRQIVIEKSKNPTSKQITALKNKISKISKAIKNGTDFGTLVKKYSQNSSSNNNSGYMPPLTWERSLSKPIYRDIFNLSVGDIKTLETQHSIYIVKIVDISNIDKKPFSKIKDEIKEKLEKNYTQTSLDEFYKYKRSLIDTNYIKWNFNSLNTILQWSKIEDFYPDMYQDTIKNLISKGKNQTILSYQKDKVDFQDFLHLASNILLPNFSKNTTIQDIKKYFIEALRTEKLVDKANAAGLEKEIISPMTNNTVLTNNIVSLYNEAVIDSQIPKPKPKRLMNFYESNKDSLYYQLAKVNIYAKIFSDKIDANKLLSKINQGMSFKEATNNRYKVKTFIKNRDGSIDSYLSREKPYLGKAAFKLEESEVDGVIEYNDPQSGKKYAVIKSTHRRPEKQLTYDDVQNTIAKDYKDYQREQIANKVVKQLRDKYEVEIYKNVLKDLIASPK